METVFNEFNCTDGKTMTSPKQSKSTNVTNTIPNVFQTGMNCSLKFEVLWKDKEHFYAKVVCHYQ
jgi:hypothetical protein